jgi:hypothetical protein
MDNKNKNKIAPAASDMLPDIKKDTIDAAEAAKNFNEFNDK